MPGPASFAAKYPQGGFGYPINSMSGKPWMVNSGGGPTLSANGGVGSYNPTGQRSDLASILAGAQTMPANGGYPAGLGYDGRLASEQFGGFDLAALNRTGNYGRMGPNPYQGGGSQKPGGKGGGKGGGGRMPSPDSFGMARL